MRRFGRGEGGGDGCRIVINRMVEVVVGTFRQLRYR